MDEGTEDGRLKKWEEVTKLVSGELERRLRDMSKFHTLGPPQLGVQGMTVRI